MLRDLATATRELATVPRELATDIKKESNSFLKTQQIALVANSRIDIRLGMDYAGARCRGRDVAQIHQMLLFEGRQSALGKVTSKTDRRVLDLAAAFLGEENGDIAYTHPGMCLTVLPHRETAPDAVWSRTSIHASLEVHPLRDAAGVYRGVPYGPKARLMLLFLQSEALKTRSRFVELGRSMRQWLLSMGVRDCGTNYKVVADQAERIENCVLRFRYQGREGESRWQDSIVRGSFRPFAEEGIAAVELSEGFYDALTRHPVPICESAIRLLADTCMPLDIYLWLAYRLHSLDQPKTISWEALHLQFGANTRLLKHFKPRFARDLEVATAVYPDAAAELTDVGIRLRQSPPPVAPRARLVAKSRTSSR